MRQRKGQKPAHASLPASTSAISGEQHTESGGSVFKNAWFWLNAVVGTVIMFVIGFKYSQYCRDLHEAQLWFTNIKEIEREISFRTESGLYYSYFKQFTNAPSISQGLHELTQDKLTEYPHTLNVLERMNIYQEVILGLLYRTVPPIHRSLKPVFWYIYSVFGLHGGLVCALYIMSWLLSGTWVTGVLATAFYIFNKDDTTRAPYIIPLRESFSLPFLWVQLAFVTFYFRQNRSKAQEVFSVVGLALSTFLFSLFWQFNQFVLLLQAMGLFGAQVLNIVPHRKIRVMYFIQLLSLLAVCVLQYFNTMIIGGLVFSFVPGALILLHIQGELPSSSGLCVRVIRIVIYIFLVFILMGLTNKVIKLVIHVDSDEHIYKFVLHKLGVENSRDMDVWMYLCVGSFDYMGWEVIQRMTKKLIFPLYCITQCGGLLLLCTALISKWRSEIKYKKSDDEPVTPLGESWLNKRPELGYHLIQAVFYGCMALTTLRMKYMWTPYVCVLGSSLLGDQHIYHWFLEKLRCSSTVLLEVLRIGVCFAVICALYNVGIGEVRKELANLREFYDPDTVELMEWINTNTPKEAAFSGSMQLMAGVKLCTERPITNHPHYEDKQLRHTTKQIMQVYGRKSAEEVHEILKECGTSYVILEDSICLVPPTRQCGSPNLMDMHNGVTPIKENAVEGITYTTAPKFCDKIRHMKPPYTKYFKEVFKNKTFRIYRVL